MRLTLRDVADATDVSVSTVSLVLRDVPNSLISDRTRQRVVAAARRLGYRHNALAAGLRKGTTDLVAFIVPELASPTLAARLAAAEAVLRAGGMRTVLWHTAAEPELEDRVLNEVLSHMTSGLIVGYAMGYAASASLEQFGRDGVPLVLLEPMAGVEAHVVTVDREQGLYLGTHHLLSLGHRRVGLAGGAGSLDLAHERGRGYARALAEFGLAPDRELVCRLRGRRMYESGYDEGKRLLAAPSPPSGLVCTDDEAAIGVMKACREMDVAIPGQLAIVGFDDLPVAAFADVPLTTVANPTDQVGRRAAEILLEDMRRGRPSSPKRVVLEPTLVVRDSSGA